MCLVVRYTLLNQSINRNNAMNKVPVAATERQQLLRQNTSVFGETTAQKPLSDFVQLKSERRKKTSC